MNAGDLIVETRCGRVEGLREANGTCVFRGIRYGQSTAGANRFQPPLPPEAWQGVRPADTFAPMAPQPSAASLRIAPAVAEIFGLTGSEPPSGEDCLGLNIWTPRPDHGRRPVMVWLHGGGFTTGFGSADGRPATNGDKLAADNDVVVVTLNHRLGCLGFLDLSALYPGRFADSANFGMLDIVAALAWIRDNIRAFGGDPGCVTLFGESGGGIKANVLMAMPAAAGLFHRVIMQSGAGAAGGHVFGLRVFDPAQAQGFTAKLLAELKLGDPAPEDLLGLSCEALMAAQMAMIAREGVIGGPIGFMPVAGGAALPRHPIEPGAARDMPTLIGTTTHEIATMLAAAPWFGTLGEAQMPAVLEPLAGAGAAALIADYRVLHPNASPTRLATLAMSDVWRLLAQRIADQRDAQGAPVFAYEFAYETEVLGGLLGANHGLDISFAFNTPERVRITGGDPARFAVAERMSRAWAAFARSGDPNHPGLPPWLAYDRSGRQAMRLGRTDGMGDLLPEAIRQAWARLPDVTGL